MNFESYKTALRALMQTAAFKDGQDFSIEVFKLVEWVGTAYANTDFDPSTDRTFRHADEWEQQGAWLLANYTGYCNHLAAVVQNLQSQAAFEAALDKTARLFTVYQFKPDFLLQGEGNRRGQQCCPRLKDKLREQPPSLVDEEWQAVRSVLRLCCGDKQNLASFLQAGEQEFGPYRGENAGNRLNRSYWQRVRDFLRLRARAYRGQAHGDHLNQFNLQQLKELSGDPENIDVLLFQGLEGDQVQLRPAASALALPSASKLPQQYENRDSPNYDHRLRSYFARERLFKLLGEELVQTVFPRWNFPQDQDWCKFWEFWVCLLGFALLYVLLFVALLAGLTKSDAAYAIFARFALLTGWMWFHSAGEHAEFIQKARWHMLARGALPATVMTVFRLLAAWLPTAILVKAAVTDWEPPASARLLGFAAADFLLYGTIAILPHFDHHHRDKDFDLPGIVFGLIAASLGLAAFDDPSPTAVLAYVTGKFHWYALFRHLINPKALTPQEVWTFVSWLVVAVIGNNANPRSVGRGYLHSTLWAIAVTFFQGAFLIAYIYDPCLYMPGNLLPVIPTWSTSASNLTSSSLEEHEGHECSNFWYETTLACLFGTFFIYAADIPLSLAQGAHLPHHEPALPVVTLIKERFRSYRERTMRIFSFALTQVFLLLSAAVPFGLVTAGLTDAESFWQFAGLLLLTRYAVMIVWIFYGVGFRPGDSVLILVEWVLAFSVEVWLVLRYVRVYPGWLLGFEASFVVSGGFYMLIAARQRTVVGHDGGHHETHTASWVFLAGVVVLDTLLESAQRGEWELEVLNYEAVVLLVALKFHYYFLAHSLDIQLLLERQRSSKHWFWLILLIVLALRAVTSWLSTNFVEETDRDKDSYDSSSRVCIIAAVGAQVASLAVYGMIRLCLIKSPLPPDEFPARELQVIE